MAYKKYFFYTPIGTKLEKYDTGCSVVSEVEFPEKSPGLCVSTRLRDTTDIPMYKKINLLFGDPRKMVYCECLSKDSKDAPRMMKRVEKKEGHPIWKFKYENKSFWACDATKIRRFRNDEK